MCWSLVRYIAKPAFWRGLWKLVCEIPSTIWFLIKAALFLALGLMIAVLGISCLTGIGAIPVLLLLGIWAIGRETDEANARHRELLATFSDTPAERDRQVFARYDIFDDTREDSAPAVTEPARREGDAPNRDAWR